jgi:hypothetical protein
MQVAIRYENTLPFQHHLQRQIIIHLAEASQLAQQIVLQLLLPELVLNKDEMCLE